MPTRRLSLAPVPAAALLLLAATLAGCGQAPPPERPPLEGASIGGDFTLVGEDGKPIAWSDFQGRYRIVYFGYTFCPDVCPTDLARIAQGWRQFDDASPGHPQIATLFVSIDPKRDTPAVLREFTDAFDPRIIGVTGEEAAVDEVAKRFAVFATRHAANPAGGYLVEHTNVSYLFDPDGKPLATLPVDAGPQAIAAELAKWVR